MKSDDKQIKLDERNHVEKPLLDQLALLDWEVLDLDGKQNPGASYRDNFTEVVMLPVLRTQLKVIQPWLEDDQVEEAVKQLTASFPSTNLLQNNQHVFRLLLEGTSVSENRRTGEKSPSVRFVDFGLRTNNRFIAVCQFKVRILGTEHHIIPDVVLFLNGLPVVVIEAKSPKVNEPIPEAIDQLLRYSEQRGAKGEGSAPLFYFNQFLVTTCRQEAKFGTITTHSEKHFYRWSDPFPRTLNDLDHGSSSPNDQQRLVAGMLDHNNLLDIIRTFTLFSSNDKGEMIKVVGRYQQFRAVKLAVQRLLAGKNPRERSGIIWHTQGSGKSLTMMFMVREMYRHATLSKWKIIFVTDRTQLEEQLSETSQSTGFTVKVADSIKTLKELLASDASDLVMAMIHKFREADLSETFPQLNDSPHVLVMTDEAHRSQYSRLAANLDKGIPNATRIGYTGTPIDKTERVFGDYIDKYTMRQAIEDGVTLEIVYEGRTHNAEVPDKAGMDTEFVDVFSDYNLEQRLEILGYGSRQAYLEAESTIEAKAKDKRQWLYEKVNHAQKYQDLPHAPGKEVINGESALYLGREYPISLTKTASNDVEFSRQFFIPLADQLKRKAVLKDWYWARAQETILPRVSRHAHELGVSVVEANIVDNRFRWGSCTTKNHVNLNWRLIKAPMFVIDYVIVHELAHLLEANHTPRFWNIVRAKAPLSEKAKAWLKEHGQVLEDEI